MTFIYMTIAIVIVFMFVMQQFNKKSKEEKSFDYSYSKKTFLLSKPEHLFYDLLVQAVGNEYYVFPQIHLDLLANSHVKGQYWKAAFRHINEKSIDFVLCDKSYISPKLAIELDDSSHEREDRQKRDEIVEGILDEINLPLLRFQNHGSFTLYEIEQLVKNKLHSS